MKQLSKNMILCYTGLVEKVTEGLVIMLIRNLTRFINQLPNTPLPVSKIDRYATIPLLNDPIRAQDPFCFKPTGAVGFRNYINKSDELYGGLSSSLSLYLVKMPYVSTFLVYYLFLAINRSDIGNQMVKVIKEVYASTGH